ncbi:EamA family transporter RarD [Gemella haemolysans]|jgi:protein rarD|uniref:RarD protein n=2 Tax=Gemella haemolysans TaxID=1379 RepID=A0AA87B7U0_9BACL|nr:EamA family transporter RarD [Gemella haemolysans]EGF86432.1 RarD protein [Gemella haemolysans M341]QIX88654.1 EamA family transporter RarD [Gemella haemolysans]
MNNTQKSLVAILICYFSWGLFPIYFKLLKSIGAYEVLAMRILCSFIFMILVVGIAKNKKTIFEEIKKIWDNKKSFLLLVLASFLITGNWLTYIIAVNTNHVLEASFGYYLNPIVTIILAVVFLKEKLTRTQTIACLFVGGSLLYLFISLGSLPWISIMLALTFGLYSLCKKKIILSPKASLLIETAIVSPIAIIYMGYLASNNSVTFHTFGTDTLIYLLLSGVITAVPLMLFAKGATDIPLYMLGILQYLPPTMQFFIGIFVYGEELSVQKLISFSIIWVAVAVFCYSAVVSMKKQNLVSESHKK